MTSTYALDLTSVIRLNKQILAHGLDHHLFIEDRDRALFKNHFPEACLHRKPDGGEGGLGRGGALVRWHVHHQMLDIVQDGDTAVNLDSDVYFLNEKMIADLDCKPGETRGFTGNLEDQTAKCTLKEGGEFWPMSGMIIAAASDIYKRAMALPREEIWAIAQHLMDNGHGCSEDVIASYLYQYRGGGKMIPLQTLGYTRSVRGPQYSRIWPSPDAGYPPDVDVIA